MRSWRMWLSLCLVVLWADLAQPADLSFRGTGGCIEDTSGTGTIWVASKGHPITVLFEANEAGIDGLARVTISSCSLDGSVTTCNIVKWDTSGDGLGNTSVFTGDDPSRMRTFVGPGYFSLNWFIGPGGGETPRLIICGIKQN